MPGRSTKRTSPRTSASRPRRAAARNSAPPRFKFALARLWRLALTRQRGSKGGLKGLLKGQAKGTINSAASTSSAEAARAVRARRGAARPARPVRAQLGVTLRPSSERTGRGGRARAEHRSFDVFVHFRHERRSSCGDAAALRAGRGAVIPKASYMEASLRSVGAPVVGVSSTDTGSRSSFRRSRFGPAASPPNAT